MVAGLIKASLYLGAILLLGAGILPRYIGVALTGPTLRALLRWGAAAGGVLVIAGSAVDIAATLQSTLGYFDLDLAWNYTLNTRHGHAIIARTGVTIAVLALRERGPGVLYVLLSIVLLGTFSWTSHAAAMGGTLPLLADLLHFAAAAAWAGPLLYLALIPNWHVQLPALQAAFRRASVTGLTSVVLLALSGTYTALIHLQDPERFVASPYGSSLSLKLLTFMAIIVVAALNRYRFLPRLLRSLDAFRNSVRIEAVLLVLIFVLTGLLTTSSLPHDPGPTPDAWDNLVGFISFLLGN